MHRNEKLVVLQTSAKSVSFSRDGDSLIVGGYLAGIQKWPILKDSQRPEEITIGSPQIFAASEFLHANLSLSEDERLGVLNRSTDEATVYDLQHSKRLHTLRATDIRYHAVSPDSRWIATGSCRGSGVRIWDAQSGDLAREIPVKGPARVLFSPNRKWLITCSAERYHVWTVSDWQPVYEIPANGNVYSCAAFTSDSNAIAVALHDGIMLANANDLPQPHLSRSVRPHSRISVATSSVKCLRMDRRAHR